MRNDLNADHLRQEVTLTLPLGVVLQLADKQPPAAGGRALQGTSLPGIGYKDKDGALFAGVSIDANGHPSLIWLLPEKFKGTWQAAMDWATKRGGSLPSRIDQLVLLRNLKSEFEREYYWSCEQHAVGAAWAWYQGFPLRQPDLRRQVQQAQGSRGPQIARLTIHPFARA